ncbi:molybdenum-pterin-binding protein [Campylobacter sp. MIT 21-1685]|uniref:molybdenum-pterin-binding protein n=1 Tax=unclassified Campylobacter TaxID=2593542 RepID=UPI00224B0961|nr:MULTISPECIES: molybdenum-pterin-binding protein [unclassified Campylobacter]MCX2683047.1 molybdenum-pterin-binding protein [Campylobacter sp. MIT 21-1684]MCX2751329.1 molybdenum-pterin-binding protein [Campylobacter sp. MIT 21-1682]MCX2807528.1 molybdenum-pterin-binding protein [Campylobacter sp. MIT 21-1685]
MNILSAKLVELNRTNELVLAKAEVEKQLFTIIMLDGMYSILHIGMKIQLLFKEHELSFGNLNCVLSIENVFNARICKIKQGEFFWQIFFDFCNLSSLITAQKGKELGLKIGDEKLCFVKANDIILRV